MKNMTTQPRMQKNLVILHLESLYHMLFWQYYADLPAIWGLKEKSLYFSKCHAAGTATIFAMTSITRGSICDIDYINAYDGKWDISKKDGLFGILRDELDYDTVFAMPQLHKNLPITSSLQGIDTAISFDELFSPLSTRDSWFAKRDHSTRPFAMLFMDFFDIGHCNISLSAWEEVIGSDVADVQRAIMGMLDEAVASLLENLERYGLLEDTVIVAYGDHGRAFNRKISEDPHLSQGVHCMADNTWVPLFIYNSKFGKGVTDRLVSLIDLHPTVLSLISPEKRVRNPCRETLFYGIDLTKETRAFAFSQNKYALQNDDARPSESLKSYAIMDGDYRLIVSAVDRKKKRGGMELYLDQTDPSNLTDLLSLYEFNDNGDIVGHDPVALWEKSILLCPTVIIPNGLAALAKRFEKMRTKLQNYIHEKEQNALRHPDARPYLFPQESFTIPAAQWKKEKRRELPERVGKGIQWLVEQQRPVLLYGAIPYGMQAAAVLAQANIEVVGFVDSTPRFHNTMIDKYPVYSPQEAAQKHSDAIVLGCQRRTTTEGQVRDICCALNMTYYSYPVDILGIKLQ